MVSVLGRRGSGRTTVEVSLEATGLEPTPHEAHRSIVEQSALLQEVLDELAIPAEQRSTTGVRVTPEWEYRDRDREHVGYRASNAVRVRLEDASIAGRLIQQATQIAGPPEPEITIEAGELDVAAALDVTFAIEQG